MTDKALCPFCGEEIEIRVCDAEGNIPLDQDAYKKDPWSGLFYCLYHPSKMDHPCPIATFRDEPLGKNLYDSEEQAYAAALRRPLQKPLTLEEACGSEEPCVYYESKLNDHLMAVNVIESKSAFFDPHTICEIRWIGSGDVKYMLTNDYGDKWRCWAANPTQEEREAARWE